MNSLKVTLIQTDPAWRNIPENIGRLDSLIEEISEPSDLIILPEMFSTGFTMEPQGLAETMTGPTVLQMTRWSKKAGADICGSIIIEEGGRYYNRLIWAKPDGAVLTYDKRHLFRMSGEHEVYTAGDKLCTIDICGWKVRPLICYDLRFPVWSRNAGNAYDLLIVVANWPEKRAEHWKTLLRARAIENQCYAIGVNRVGVDGNHIAYSGNSAVIDFTGTTLWEKSHAACIQTVELSLDKLHAWREEFPAWRDADDFRIMEEAKS